MSKGDTGQRGWHEDGQGGKKVKAKEWGEAQAGSLLPPLLCPLPLRSSFFPPWALQARQAAAEDRRLRLEKALLTFAEQSRIWLL